MKTLGSILEEIQAISPPRDPISVVSDRGRNVFESVCKLITFIEREFPAQAEDLAKRFFNAARTGDYRKFERGIDQLRQDFDRTKDTPGPKTTKGTPVMDPDDPIFGRFIKDMGFVDKE